jgi:hypothetical protein
LGGGGVGGRAVGRAEGRGIDPAYLWGTRWGEAAPW